MKTDTNNGMKPREDGKHILGRDCILIEEFSTPGDLAWSDRQKESKIVFITEGTMNLRYIGSDYVINSGEMFVLPKNVYYEVHTSGKTAFMVFCLSIGVHVADLFPIVGTPDGASCRKGEIYILPIHPEIMDFLRTTYFTLEAGADIGHYYEFKFRELTAIMKKYYTTEQLTQLLCPILYMDTGFVNVVLRNYEKVKTVMELAELSNMSLSSFKKHFKENFGQPPYVWMKQQKCIRLLDDIIEGSMSFKEICDKYDFSSMSQMTTFSKTNFGKTPSRIRTDGKGATTCNK